LATAERWRRFPELPEMIDILSVSIDAARSETYERLRHPAKWTTLMKNLELMAEMRRSGSIRRLQVNFVVQEANYRQIPEFVELGARMSADSIWFQRVTNYGAYGESAFATADVTSPTHPEHQELLEILRSPVMRHPAINMEMLLPLLPEVVASDMRLPMLRIASRRKAFDMRAGLIEAQTDPGSQLPQER
jgi:wyosine [tRNA(Phe)-imidazoG37] synthetase (radical SAM superfamily)